MGRPFLHVGWACVTRYHALQFVTRYRGRHMALTNAEKQRAYRARAKSERNKVVRVVDAWDAFTMPTPEKVAELRAELRNALPELERRGEEIARLTARNAWLEAELLRVERNHTNSLKDNIVLKQEIAALKGQGAGGRAPR